VNTADLPPDVLAFLTHLSCVGLFCTKLAHHADVSIEDAANRLNVLGPNLRCLTESPQGWTALSQLVAPDRTPMAAVTH
jgi:hypothetical protein